jgi:hypothetical protein
MTMTRARRSLFFVISFSLAVVLLGCPQKPAPVVDAGAEPAPTPTPSVTQIAPLNDDDGGPDAAEAGPKKWNGPPVNPNQQKIKACCNAMRATHDPTMMALAGQCDMIASQVGPSGSDPAFAQLRAILKSAKLPGACSGL